MTKVTFAVGEDTPQGVRLGYSNVSVRPLRRRMNGDIIVTRATVTYALDAAPLVIELDPTDVGEAWLISIVPSNGDIINGYFKVPYDEAVPFAQLIEVDPNTMKPNTDPDPEWWAMVSNTVTDGQVIDGDLILERYDGSTTNAGHVQGPEGPRGYRGFEGARGIQGEPGEQGLQGEQGVKGDKGDNSAPKALLTYSHNETVDFKYTFMRIVNGVGLPNTVQKKLANGGTSVNVTYQGVDSLARRYGHGLVVNGSSWNTDTNVLRSLQILDGVILKEDEADGYSRYCVGVKADGSLKVYPLLSNTGATLLADGVVNTFAHREAYVVDGVPVEDLTTSTEISARTILGWDDKDIYVITIHGVTALSGATQLQAQALCVDLGLTNAVALDGGGSTQAVINTHDVHPSSDTVRRLIPDFMCFDVDTNAAATTRWEGLPLEGSATAHTVAPAYRLKDGTLEAQGGVINNVTGSAQIASLPWYARPMVHQRIPCAMGNIDAYYDVTPLGAVSRYTSIATPNIGYINPIRYSVR